MRSTNVKERNCMAPSTCCHNAFRLTYFYRMIFISLAYIFFYNFLFSGFLLIGPRRATVTNRESAVEK